MKIAFYHELHKGGARIATNEFAKQLKQRGHLVDLYTLESGYNEKLFYSNIFIYNFFSKKYMRNNPLTRLYKDSIELLKLVVLNIKISNTINRRKYDAIFVAASQYIESPFILHFLTATTFFYCHDPYYRILYEPNLFNAKNLSIFKKKYEAVNRFIRKYLDKWNISKAKYVIFNSKFTGSLFTSVYKKGGKVIPCGVDASYFKPKNVKKKFDLLFIGSFDSLDGYPFFQEIVSLMKTKPKIRIVTLEKEWLSKKQLLEIYNQTKIYVSVSYKEPLGMAPMEAMSCGIPTVAVDEGGPRETVINSKTGYLLKRETNLFVSKLDFLLTHNEVLKKMGHNSRMEMVKNWDWVLQGEKIEQYMLSKMK